MEERPHRELVEFVENPEGKRKKLILMPRGSFKSSVVTVGRTIHKLIKNPNLRILIAGETQKNATKFVKEIKSQFESNEKLRALFGDFVSKDNTWRDNEFIISKRSIVKKESTIMAASLEKQSTTSQHYDMIVLDDPCSQNNVNTPEQIQKTIDYYRLLLSVLEPDGEIIIIGTRYSPLDLYGWVTDPSNPERNNFDIIIKEAYNEDGSLLFPEVLNEKFLEEQKQAQGTWAFSCQYLNRPINPDTCFFKPDTIQFFQTQPENLIYFLTYDAAISQKARGDYSAFVVNGVDHLGRWFIVEAIQRKLPPSEIVDFIFELVQKYSVIPNRFQCLGMEKHALEQMLKVALSEEMNKRKFWFPIKDVPTDTRFSKERRIAALEPKFNKREIFIKKDMLDLHHQILYYPTGVKNDDLLDALKSQLQIATYASWFEPSSNGFPQKPRDTGRAEQLASEEIIKYYGKTKKNRGRLVRL